MGGQLRKFLTGCAAIVLVVPLLGLSGAATSAKPQYPPSQPRDVAASPGAGSAKVSWRPPKKAGGAPIDRYKVVRSAKGVPRKSFLVAKGKRSFTVRGLVNGKTYTFTVLAHSALGWSRPSRKATAVPRTVPTAPRSLLADSVERTVDLTWSAPSNNGGDSVDGYRVQRSTNSGATWVTVASPATTQSTLAGLAYGTPYRFRVLALNAAGASPPSSFVTVTPVPPPCPDPLPAAGPYLEVSCDPADGVVVHTCLNPDWKDLNGLAADGCEATRQMPFFIVGDPIGTSSAQAYADRLSGSFWLSGYPGDRDPEDWFEVNPMVAPIPTTCPQVACPGGQPQDPAPTLELDFAPQAGDAARRSVLSQTGQSRFTITYRARVTTPDPVAFQVNGVDCFFDVDSTVGATPDLKIDLAVQFSNLGWQQQAGVPSLVVSQLENADASVSGGVTCSFLPSMTGFIQEVLTSGLTEHFAEQVASTCGADDPHWWQACRTVVEEPPPPPPAPPTPSSCPTAPPPAGPYLTLSCHPSTGQLVRSCHADWLDQNQVIADGCERSVAGLVPVQHNATTDQAIADRLSGSFYLGGYPGGNGAGTRYVAPDPWPVPILGCAVSGAGFACLDGADQDPMPTLELDFETGGLPDRRIGQYDATQTATLIQLQAVARTNAPVVFRHSGVTCQVSIDSTAGPDDDIALRVFAQGSGQGPLTILSAGPDTLADLEDHDITVGPHRWCSYWAQSRGADVRSWVADTLHEWAKREGRLCGAPAPYYWQRAPAAGCG